MIGKNECSENILMAITAGGFMYIATVNTLPTVTQEKSGLLQIILEVMCFVSGVGFMVLVAILESLGEGGHH
jgi:zinc transporter ZupT